MGHGGEPLKMIPKVTAAHRLSAWGANVGHGRLAVLAVGGSIALSWVFQRLTTDFNKDPTATPEWAKATSKYLAFQKCNPIRGTE